MYFFNLVSTMHIVKMHFCFTPVIDPAHICLFPYNFRSECHREKVCTWWRLILTQNMMSFPNLTKLVLCLTLTLTKRKNRRSCVSENNSHMNCDRHMNCIFVVVLGMGVNFKCSMEPTVLVVAINFLRAVRLTTAPPGGLHLYVMIHNWLFCVHRILFLISLLTCSECPGPETPCTAFIKCFKWRILMNGSLPALMTSWWHNLTGSFVKNSLKTLCSKFSVNPKV